MSLNNGAESLKLSLLRKRVPLSSLSRVMVDRAAADNPAIMSAVAQRRPLRVRKAGGGEGPIRHLRTATATAYETGLRSPPSRP